jgi:hypothetical protein
LFDIIHYYTFVPETFMSNHKRYKMKTILSFAIIVFATFHTYGQSPEFQWGATMISSDPGTNGTSALHRIKANANGEIFVLGTFGTSSVAQQAQKENSGEPTAKGRVHVTCKHYTATGELTSVDSPNGLHLESGLNTNANLCLYKIDRNGNLLWQVTSDRGDINASYSPMIPTNDGGALLVLKVRHHAAYGDDETGGNNLLRLIDKNNAKTSITWDCGNVNAYQGVTVKINADGTVEWIKRNIQVEFSPIGSYTTTDAAIYFYDLTTDKDGNYYLCGRFARPVTFNRSGGETITLTPHNTTGWDGYDSSRGDLLLVKLDTEGNLLRNLETTGIVKQQTVECLAYHTDKLYIFGRIQADTINTNASSSAFLGRTIVPGKREDTFIARLDVSGETPQLDWLNHFVTKPQTNGKGGSILPLSLNYDNGVLLATGYFTGFIATGNNESDNILSNDLTSGTAQAAQLGFILKQDAATGNLTGQVKDHIGGIGAHIRTAVYRENKIHAYGTALGSLWYASYDADFSNPVRYPLASIENATATEALFLNDGFIVLGRGKHVPDIAGAPDAFHDNNPEGLSAVMISYLVDGLQKGDETSIKQFPETVNSLKIVSHAGVITISGSGGVKVINLCGQVVYSGFIRNSTKGIAPGKGVYIVVSSEKAVKVLVK